MTQVTDDINRAMRSYTSLVLKILYIDAKGKQTIRIVSPYQWIDGGHQFIALCLAREEPRQFKLDRIKRTQLVKESDVLMPEPIQEVLS